MDNVSHTQDILEDQRQGDNIQISEICFELEMICRNYMKISQLSLIHKKIRRPKKTQKQTEQQIQCKCGHGKEYHQYFQMNEQEKVFEELQSYQKRLFGISELQLQLSKLKANLAFIK